MVYGLRVHERVAKAIRRGRPVVALETAVATHGLPTPHNVDAMVSMDTAIRRRGAEPAACVVQGGELHVGAPLDLVAEVAHDSRRVKASIRDLGLVLSANLPAGLTVSASLYAAQRAGITVFATGGIGGVHLGAERTGDVSADLLQLSVRPVLTVCSGAKSVLDIPRTLEHLESLGVPAYAFGSAHFPAFYLRSSGVSVPCLESAREVAGVAACHWSLGLTTGIVLGNPLPDDQAISESEWSDWIGRAQRKAETARTTGKDVTPYLLARVAEYSGGRTVTANVELLRRNAGLAAEIAVALRERSSE